ncbi:MAG: Lipoprotein-releasing system ATP-binding protein LolD [Lentisphaerae bacterium ADurb.BinA184]|nr:MAG: Lipoprotein-releasing system ATP-binding protein LolD [Lentisphaerae bacterium ADurb.BinA184]
MYNEPAFRVEGVAKDYWLGRHAISVLRAVDLSVEQGEWIALVGASGSGKTTLLHLLGALEKPTRGTVACLGRRLAPPPLAPLASGRRPAWLFRTACEWRRSVCIARQARFRGARIGYVFQAYHLLPELSALENAALPALARAVTRRRAHAHAAELLTEFGLGHRLHHRPQELSGGEQQRVALARALVNAPSILLADEPTGNLDAEASGQIMDILRGLHRERGMTIVMVTHDLRLAARAQRILRLRDGCVEAAPQEASPS